MNEEFNELFDIKDDEKEISILGVPKQNVLVHSIIRAVILIITTVLTLGIFFVVALGGGMNLAILAGAVVIAWFGLMIFEVNKLKKKRKNQLASANIVLIVIAVVLLLILIAYIATLR